MSLFGLEGEELDREAPRVERAFRFLGISPFDVTVAKERLLKFFSMELLGMRKIWGIALKELVDLVLAKEEGKKVVYGSFPPLSDLLAAGAMASDEIYCSPAEAVIDMVLCALFGESKISPILDTGEKYGLTSSLASCSFLKTRLGAIINGVIPVPDLLISSAFLCDQTPKTDEILHELYGIPVAYVDNIFENKGDKWPQDISPRRIKYFANEIKHCTDEFNKILGCQISEQEIRLAIDAKGKLFRALDELWEFMKADPIPLSQNDFGMIANLVYSATRRGLREGGETLHILQEEVKRRVSDGKGAVKKGAPRVLLTVPPMDPSLVAMIENVGLAIPVTTLAGTPAANVPISYDSVWEQIADSMMRRRGGQYSSWGYIFQLRELVKTWNVDGVIIFVHIPCRQYQLFPPKAREVMEELGIPVLMLEGDYVDIRGFNAEQMRTRLETFVELVRYAQSSRRK